MSVTVVVRFLIYCLMQRIQYHG